MLAEELKCDVSEVADFELNLYDTQPGCIGGARDDFVFAGRLDNLAATFCALWALLDTCADPSSLVDESCIRMIALYDSGEVPELLIFYHRCSSYHFIALTSCCSLTLIYMDAGGRAGFRTGSGITDNAAGHDTYS